MKKIFIILLVSISSLFACKEDTFTTDPGYEKAEITGVELYNGKLVRADQKVTINSASNSIEVLLKKGEEIRNLKLVVTASTGVLISPSMSVGYQDLSQPKTYQVTSPGRSVSRDWTITVLNP